MPSPGRPVIAPRVVEAEVGDPKHARVAQPLQRNAERLGLRRRAKPRRELLHHALGTHCLAKHRAVGLAKWDTHRLVAALPPIEHVLP